MNFSVSYKNQNNLPSFGKVIIKNKKSMPPKFLSTLETLEHDGFLADISKDRDIVVRLMSKKPGFFDTAHKKSGKIYNLSFVALKKDSWFSRTLDYFWIKTRQTIAHNYHDDIGIVKRLNDNKHVEKLKTKLLH